MDQDQMAMPAMLTQHAKDQVAAAKRAAADLDTPEKALAAGYRPRFGDVPLRGEHWTNPRLVLTGIFEIEHPPILLFAPIDDTQKLLGVAVLGLQRDAVDSMVPQLEAARRAGKKAQYQAVAVKIGNKADEIVATSKQVPAHPISRAFLAKLMDEALSDSHAAKDLNKP